MKSVAIGIDMGGTLIKLGLIKEGGEIIDVAKIEASAQDTLEKNLIKIGTEADCLLQKNGAELLGVGIAFPGIVDSVKHRVLSKYIKYADAQKTDFAAWVTNRWHVPFALENDARAALLGEWKFGAGRNCDNLVLITLGTGVGSAAMIDGKLLKGKHFLAGNLGGHMCINLHGQRCNCGNTGCVETEASTWSVHERAKQSAGFQNSTLSQVAKIDFDTLFFHAKNGDKLALDIQVHCLKTWSVCILNLIHAYDPQRVIIGGGVMKSKDLIMPHFKKMIREDAWINMHEIDIVAAQQVEHAGVLGMAYLTGHYLYKNSSV